MDNYKYLLILQEQCENISYKNPNSIVELEEIIIEVIKNVKIIGLSIPNLNEEFHINEINAAKEELTSYKDKNQCFNAALGDLRSYINSFLTDLSIHTKLQPIQ